MAQKRPFATNEQIEALARVYPTPFYLYDEAGIRRTAEALTSAFSWAPSFREYFAVKATPNPAIISILAEYGCGVDCSSECELLMAEALGLSGERIMFCSNDTPAGEFAHAGRLGATIILDDETHIDALLAEQGALPERVGLRFNPGGDFDFANGIFGRPEEAKFGLTEDQLLEAATRLRELGVQQIGLHALLASNTLTNDYYPALARRLFRLAVRLQAERGIRIAYPDLSGRVDLDHPPEGEPNDAATSGAGLRRAYEE
ncbi:MAG: diaminopimelate decarboxylase, partial [Atopobiaceae bacterium]|nr:diaminopimelate decarboxylase [Atopobiaceae bacterium]